MTKVNIAIKTIDRSPKRNFLGETLKNLERSGVFRSEHLGELALVDSGSPDVGEFLRSEEVEYFGDKITVLVGKRTLHQNAQACIEQVSKGDAKWGLVLEDDIDVCNRFLESVVSWLTEHELHSPMMYVFGACYDQIAACWKREETMWPYPVRSFYGALACAWRRDVAADLAKWLGPDPFYLNKDGEEVRNHGHDLKLAQWGMEEVGLANFLCAVPNFVQHVGNESSLQNKMVVYPAWGGREWSYA